MERKKYLYFIFLLILICGCESDKYNPSKYIQKDKEQELIYSVIRYAAKLPPNSNHELKFDPSFDPYYKTVAAEFRIGAYYIDADSTHYILFIKPARSVVPMNESIGCKITFDKNDSIAVYEEVFRTWKMPEETLNKRFPILFDKMVKGESLEPYYSKNSGDQFIEFPDDRFYFDKEERKWKDSVFDSTRVN